MFAVCNFFCTFATSQNKHKHNTKMDIENILQLLAAIVGSGGLVAYFLLPEKKSRQRLDNAERLILKYEPIIERLEKDNADKDAQIKELIKRINKQDLTIGELNTKIRTMEIIGREDRMLRCENVGCKKRKPPINKECLTQTQAEQ